ncbi:MAG: metallophosphoesterase, partial [Gammaproteobacteria bacterium]|nr:metallophosphoesterase [Gammaproteobacteria bacterium]
FIGHVHVPKVFYLTAGDALRDLDPESGTPIPLSMSSRYVVNVGSVGQPRDGNNATCYVLYDSDAATITFYRLPYDHLSAADKILTAGLSSRFAERLLHGA